VAGAGIVFCLWLMFFGGSNEQLGMLLGIMIAGVVLRWVSGRAATRVTLAA
jgi:hypothetical protein